MGSYYCGNIENYSFNDLTTYVYKNEDIFYTNILMSEIRNENLEEVKWLLLRMKVDPNILLPEADISPVHFLAGMENEYFSVEVMHLVLQECNGNPNLRSKDGLTPVHLAAIWGRCKVLELLINFGGDPNLVEYKTSLSAEDLALREHQWQAHAILATFIIMDENEDFKTKMCENSVKINPCEHKLLINELKTLFIDTGTEKLSNKNSDNWLKTSFSLDNDTKSKTVSTGTQTPPPREPDDDQNISKTILKDKSKLGKSTDSIHSEGSFSSVKANAKAFGKTATTRLSRLFQFIVSKFHISNKKKKIS